VATGTAPVDALDTGLAHRTFDTFAANPDVLTEPQLSPYPG